MSIYIGLDQSYSNTGYVIIDDNGTTLKTGTINSPKTDGDIFARAKYIAMDIAMIVCEYKECINNIWHTPIICIEGLSFGGFGSATRDLAGLQFMIINTLRDFAINDITVLPPTSLKKFALGKGKGSKEDMLAAVPSDIYDFLINTGYKKSKGLYDVVDAYWLAHYIRDKSSKDKK